MVRNRFLAFTSCDSNTDLHFLQATSDKLLGSIMLFVAIFVFSYYTVWALLTVRHQPLMSSQDLVKSLICRLIVQPFLDSSSKIHDYFPPREYAVRLPASLLVVGGAVVALFIGNVMWKESRKRKLRAGKAA
jgi:dolichyl-phosphate mannosyltransferase polypeptide 2 regulatory subunit